uniref:Uncharacterized protein n=1 Tax=Arion vulgaris TaxID=1028688 RepID=A0A0B7BD13_9EUPU
MSAQTSQNPIMYQREHRNEEDTLFSPQLPIITPPPAAESSALYGLINQTFL